jgi:hypothetical protein
MKTRKVLYTLSGVFNCVIGGLGCFLGLMFFAISKLVKNMFAETSGLLDGFVAELAKTSSDYEYLLDASKDEMIAFVMKIVYILSAVLIVLGLIWIAFGVFNCLLSTRHELVFGKRRALKIIFVVASWLLLTFNIANITTTIAVFLKDKDGINSQPLYTSENNS